MAHLVKIGNSQGIRIPKPLVEQARLEGKELEFKIVGDGLLISPAKQARENWKEQIEQAFATHGHEAIDAEWLDLSLAADDDLEW